MFHVDVMHLYLFINIFVLGATGRVVLQQSHLAVGEVEVIAHLHRQRALAAAAEIHDAVLAASVRDIVDCKNSLTCRVSLRKTRQTDRKYWGREIGCDMQRWSLLSLKPVMLQLCSMLTNY